MKIIFKIRMVVRIFQIIWNLFGHRIITYRNSTVVSLWEFDIFPFLQTSGVNADPTILLYYICLNWLKHTYLNILVNVALEYLVTRVYLQNSCRSLWHGSILWMFGVNADHTILFYHFRLNWNIALKAFGLI